MSDIRVERLRELLPRCMLADWVRLGTRLVRLLQDHRHSGKHSDILDRLLAQALASVELREKRRVRVPKIEYPPELPITSRKDEIVRAIRSNQIVIIAGETGSGKTTQLPKMCLEAGLGIEAKIACTQPRRVAALSISKRISSELNVAWGREIGCKIRFDDRSSPESYIKLLTDGMLLAETQGDPLLTEYNGVIIDEAHERSLNIDFLLGYLKGLLARRDDLKLLITSATIDTHSFSRAFGDAPIIEVSGRVFPVEVSYAPLDRESVESGDVTYIDGAADAVGNILQSGENGDVLIFMPAERDIRETRDILDGRYGGEAEIIPLFGRLSSGEQQRVFELSRRRKIVIATNIAETSLTIPGIRWVIDSGLARISRYNPRTRTKRLPIEAVAQSSANQRKGRAGRVQDGVCIRLYSEEDFLERPLYTQPEIQRANLAEVILRMKAFQLGEIETFPFVNPPEPASIESGYRLLRELGAIDEERRLTDLGCDLARLPIDPTLGRMLLQSEREGATQELLIIAAGLSIQDPRERPMDRRDAADAAHRKFLDPKSDFLTLLKIWREFHDQWESLRTQNQLRKFCRSHFLSYTRMREWQDLHAQLTGALDGLGVLALSKSASSYESIHRSILSGLLGHAACATERNQYTATGNRRVMIFPGSTVFERNAKPPKGENRPAKNDSKKLSANQPGWIVAGEIVETSQLFARTIAAIDPMWIVDLAPHICSFVHEAPHWNAAAGRVLVRERILLYGLEIHRRNVGYGKIDPIDATKIFIRSALVEENLAAGHNAKAYMGRGSGELESKRVPGANSVSEGNEKRTAQLESDPALDSGEASLPGRYAFLAHNHRVRQKIETWQTRVRHRNLPDIDESLFEFYASRIENVSSIHELDQFLRDGRNLELLFVSDTDLTGGKQVDYDGNAFPNTVVLSGQPVALSYAYAPGQDHDGVTLKLPLDLARSISGALLDWAVPGLREEKIAELLRALPKSVRKPLMPFAPKLAEIVREFEPTGDSLQSDLSRFLHKRYGVPVQPSDWQEDALPNHLRPRFEILDNSGKSLAAGRDLNVLRTGFEKAKQSEGSRQWANAAEHWERFDLSGWTFGDVPNRVLVEKTDGVEMFGWPGLQVEDQIVNLRLFRSREMAWRSSVGGIQRLIEIELGKEFAWLRKDLGALARFGPLISGYTTIDRLQSDAFEHLRRHMLPSEPFPELTGSQFASAVKEVRKRLRGIVPPLVDRIGVLLGSRREILSRCEKTATSAKGAGVRLSDLGQLALPKRISPSAQMMLAELAVLLPGDFLSRISFDRLPQVPRYMKAISTRGERAAVNPLKDQERARRLAPFLDALAQFQSSRANSTEGPGKLDEFRWMIEEFKVSLFAQELGTAIPISEKRLEQQLADVRQAWL